MGKYTPFYHDIYTDAKFDKYCSSQKLMFKFLITYPLARICGFYPLLLSEIKRTTKIGDSIPRERLNEALKSKDPTNALAELLSKDKIYWIKETLKSFSSETVEYDFEEEIVYVKNYFKHKLSTIGNAKVAHEVIMKNLKDVPHKKFVADFTTRYAEEIMDIKIRKEKIIEEAAKRKASKNNLTLIAK